MKNKVLKINNLPYFTPAIVWGIFISYYTLVPASSLPKQLVVFNDKFLHAGVYFFSACLIYLGFIRYNFKNHINSAQMWFIVLLCTVFGGFIELAQHYLVTNRHGEWLDFLANTLGAIACVLLLHFLHRSRA